MSANNIKRYVGDNYPIKAVLKENGVVVNLTGSTITMKISKVNEELTINGIVTDAINGLVQFDVTAADMTPIGEYKYRIYTTVGTVVTTYTKALLIIS